jgi:hypothetical protein
MTALDGCSLPIAQASFIEILIIVITAFRHSMLENVKFPKTLF